MKLQEEEDDNALRLELNIRAVFESPSLSMIRRLGCQYEYREGILHQGTSPAHLCLLYLVIQNASPGAVLEPSISPADSSI